MELKPYNRAAGLFEISATTAERETILGAIADHGLHGLERDALTRRPSLSADIIGTIDTATEWERNIVEVVGHTLEASLGAGDARTLAARTLLRSQVRTALEQNPRR